MPISPLDLDTILTPTEINELYNVTIETAERLFPGYKVSGIDPYVSMSCSDINRFGERIVTDRITLSFRSILTLLSTEA